MELPISNSKYLDGSTCAGNILKFCFLKETKMGHCLTGSTKIKNCYLLMTNPQLDGIGTNLCINKR